MRSGALCLAIWAAVLMPYTLRAEEETAPAGAVETSEPAAVPAKPPIFRRFRLEPAAGFAGVFSTGAQNPAVVLDGRLAYRFDAHWRAGLAYWARTYTNGYAGAWFHGGGLEGEYRPLAWLGVGASAGPAAVYIASGSYRENALGAGWSLSLNLDWPADYVVAIHGKIICRQAYVRQLYTEIGGVIGPALAW